MRRILLTLALLAHPAWAEAPFATFESASDQVLNDPHDLEIGPDGRLYVADKFAGSVVVMDPETLEVVDSFGDGALFGVHDISFGPDGKAYVAVTGTGSVAVFGFDTGQPVLETTFGPFPRTEGALAHSNGRLYAMASGSGQLFVVEDNSLINAVGGMPGAHDVAEAPDGSIWVADNFQQRLVRFSEDLEQLQVLDDAKYGFIGPRYLDIDEFGRLIVADQDAHRVLMIDPASGDLLGVIGDGTPGLGPGKLDDPEGVEIQGNTYFFSDSDNNRIVKYVVVIN